MVVVMGLASSNSWRGLMKGPFPARSSANRPDIRPRYTKTRWTSRAQSPRKQTSPAPAAAPGPAWWPPRPPGASTERRRTPRPPARRALAADHRRFYRAEGWSYLGDRRRASAASLICASPMKVFSHVSLNVSDGYRTQVESLPVVLRRTPLDGPPGAPAHDLHGVAGIPVPISFALMVGPSARRPSNGPT